MKISGVDFECLAILFWDPFCFNHLKTGHICPVFEWLKQDGQPLKNRTQVVSKKCPFKNQTDQFLNGHCTVNIRIPDKSSFQLAYFSLNLKLIPDTIRKLESITTTSHRKTWSTSVDHFTWKNFFYIIQSGFGSFKTGNKYSTCTICNWLSK
jgi:hypothetical protein